MQDAFTDGLLFASPSVLITYLRVLEALAQTEPGSRAMFSQLRQDSNSPLSWQRLLGTMRQYCQKYSSGIQQVISAPAAARRPKPNRAFTQFVGQILFCFIDAQDAMTLNEEVEQMETSMCLPPKVCRFWLHA